MDQVANIFQNRTTPADLSSVSITPSPTDLNIPANLLGNHRIKNDLYISCDSMDYPLIIDPRAFNPSAVAVDALTIYNCVTYLSIFESQLMDVGANRVLNWVLESSRDTLSTLRLEKLNLSKIPTQISDFSSLTYVNIKDNKEQIPVISANSFSFNKTVPIIDLISVQRCQVVDIEVGAFQGTYLL